MEGGWLGGKHRCQRLTVSSKYKPVRLGGGGIGSGGGMGGFGCGGRGVWYKRWERVGALLRTYKLPFRLGGGGGWWWGGCF